jgi:guanylate kinase
MNKALLSMSGPSGAGKTYLCNELFKTGGYELVISHTTRKPRDGEVDGKDYYFVSNEYFEHKHHKWVEEIEFHGNKYGATQEELDRIWNSGKIPVLILTPEGVLMTSQYCQQNEISYTPVYFTHDLDVLIERFVKRDSNFNEYSAKRVLSILEEWRTWGNLFDYTFKYNMARSTNTVSNVVKHINMLIEADSSQLKLNFSPAHLDAVLASDSGD